MVTDTQSDIVGQKSNSNR